MKLYESISFDEVHRNILDLLPEPPAAVLDIGAGSGRDAAALCVRGYVVTAVEPAKMLREEAARLHRELPIEWIEDSLPLLRRMGNRQFDLILISAVWMHLTKSTRRSAVHRLGRLLKPGGRVVVTFREGPADPIRAFSPVRLGEVLADSQSAGIQVIRQVEDPDRLERGKSQWTTVVLEKPL
ncbi:class I SAM-dependent methyltransferase [Rhizobium leguminosarum]|uniref:class I SAM-dependent methyltransferase n=1 Tax=Rhizobium leguminosarum TaxID=384 RepID=UPI0012F8E887|nr:class I SAM-dependent methyltransferase [Rhizobium leguminosarum]